MKTWRQPNISRLRRLRYTALAATLVSSIVTTLFALAGGLGHSVVSAQPASACVYELCPHGDAQDAYEHTPD